MRAPNDDIIHIQSSVKLHFSHTHIHTEAPLPPKIATIESLSERTSLTWTHNTVCFNTSDIEYVVSWVDLASGGGINGTTVERNFTIRTGVRGCIG